MGEIWGNIPPQDAILPPKTTAATYNFPYRGEIKGRFPLPPKRDSRGESRTLTDFLCCGNDRFRKTTQLHLVVWLYGCASCGPHDRTSTESRECGIPSTFTFRSKSTLLLRSSVNWPRPGTRDLSESKRGNREKRYKEHMLSSCAILELSTSDQPLPEEVQVWRYRHRLRFSVPALMWMKCGCGNSKPI